MLLWKLERANEQHEGSAWCDVLRRISGSWFRASAMITMNKNQRDAQ
jgi:hypothetical protein